MRSELVFLAGHHMQNRFMLCHWVRVASRRFHKTGEPIQATISKVLALVTEQQLSDLADCQAGSARVPLDSASGVRRDASKSPASSARLREEPIRKVG